MSKRQIIITCEPNPSEPGAEITTWEAPNFNSLEIIGTLTAIQQALATPIWNKGNRSAENRQP